MRRLVAHVLLWTVRAATKHAYVEVNMTSRGRGFTMDTAPPVQYIHIPKAGGTTLQASMKFAIQDTGRKVHLYNSMGRTSGCHREQNMIKGQYYAGHASIGYFSYTFRQMSPIYILVTREPIALMISLYDFTATVRPETIHKAPDFERDVQAFKDREAALNAQGVPYDGMLDKLLQQNIEHIKDFHAFYVPCDCDMADPQNRTTAALHNVLRVDVVTVLEDFATLVPQLDYHLPWLKPFNLARSRNKVGRAPQKIEQDTLESLMNTELYDIQSRIYQFTRTLARARADYATQCLKGPCPPDMVPVEVDPRDFRALHATKDVFRQSTCLVPPANGQSWPNFVW
eukprot:CAMPEP_0198645248 /NCGR_PEP_ID=MMETSP1467-20131203/1151_1 /TAXON_ID=1462469 /ORGANISM="unid. sp., Strain CCMP2135" /LENGTH=341 /DNA_ID=CAMNT_0044380737 /DNA_START=27 /DNA_END=1052 /DNA_ORIENTATION=+